MSEPESFYIEQVNVSDYKLDCSEPAKEILQSPFIFKVDYDSGWTRHDIAELDREMMKWLHDNVSYAYAQTFYSRTWIGFQNASDATHFKLMFS